ncbi:MAG: alkaline phosphatase [Clostridia bacterium]|nr:alkaline phosphatase [Clostridia bacterium]
MAFWKQGQGKRWLGLVLAIGIVLSLPGWALAETPPATGSQPQAKNVILMIGDGMGEEHVEAIRAAKAAAGQKLAMDAVDDAKCLMTTYSADSDVTDSSSAAAAMATGYKTNNNWMSVLPDGTVVPTILEQAEKIGKATGLVTTTQVAHATPAAFASHIMNRNDFNTIAVEELASGVDVLMGGGRNNFDARPDGRDLITVAKNKGYTYVSTAAEMQAASANRLLGLFHADNGLTPMKKRPADTTEPTLSQMTAKALETLQKDPDGFFLMVEGGQIDWESHANNFDGMIGEGVEFDNAVQKALDFVSQHPDTLLIVTADHETGGLTYNEADGSYKWSSNDHTGATVAVRAEGPGADQFKTAEIDNTDIARKIAAVAGYPKPLVLQSSPDDVVAGRQLALKVTSYGLPVEGAVINANGDTLGSTDANGELVCTPDSRGLFSIVAATDFAATGKVVNVRPAVIPAFTDIANSFAKEDIQFLAEQEIIRGITNTKFDCGSQLSRAQFAAWVARALRLEPSDKAPGFKDVPAGHWALKEIRAAAEAGIVKGFNDSSFKPEDPINREQLAAMVARALVLAAHASLPSADQAKSILARFQDQNQISPGLAQEVALAVDKNIVRGVNGKFDPAGVATREQAAAMLGRMYRQLP